MLTSAEVTALGAELAGYRALPPFEAALPFYECIIEVRLMVRQPLTALERVVLAALQSGVDQVETIELVLGLEEAMVTDALADLANGELIEPHPSDDESGRYVLTGKGRDAHERSSTVRPESLRPRVLFDALTGELVPTSRRECVNPGEARNRGLHVLPSKLSPPTVTDIDRSALAEALLETRRQNRNALPDAELHDVVEVLRTLRQYLPCDVVAFDAEDGSNVVFRVQHQGRRMKDHEAVLNTLFPLMPEILPLTRAPRPSPPEAEAARGLAEAIVGEMDRLNDSASALDGRIAEAEAQLEEAGAAAEDGRPTTRMQLEAVRSELGALKRQHQEVCARLASVRRVATHEHRALLERALRESRQRVVVISPWLRREAVSDLLGPIRKALDRGVCIYIGWGYPDDEKDPAKAAKNDAMRLELEKIARERHRGRLYVVKLGDTHEKVLIADRTFMVVTSFNWLSFRGDPHRGLRHETGLYLELQDRIDEAAGIYLQRLGVQEKLSCSGAGDPSRHAVPGGDVDAAGLLTASPKKRRRGRR